MRSASRVDRCRRWQLPPPVLAQIEAASRRADLARFGACSCPLPQGLDRLRRCAAPLGDQAGFPALPSLRSVQDG
ncbi:hypothetical protein EWH08_19275 [Sphingobium indicum]|uniref:Uncharacterized protein n=1 Tax=Sphingobium indicum TaxID=332055 RepID=A0A4V1W8R9_9SPHN|nr:hypothetical protein EWH08_19275 [Sphingobium indicum]